MNKIMLKFILIVQLLLINNFLGSCIPAAIYIF